MSLHSPTPVASSARRLHNSVRLCAIGVAVITSLCIQGAFAAGYMEALESEAADVKPAKQPTRNVTAPKAAIPAAGKDPYLSALEAEADDLESQQTQKKREDSTGVRFSRIRY